MEKQFLVDINPNAELPKYELVLCKLNEEPLQTLKNITDFESRPYFANIDEISFNIPLYRTQNDGTNVRNELYDLVDGNMLVLLNEMKYFTLIKPKIISDKKTGKTHKEILGYSREYEFSRKQIIGYEGISRKIYDYSNSKDENGLEIGFLNYVERRTSWKVGYVNTDILLKFRGLNFSKVNMLQSFQEVQRTFGCLFQFDTMNKTINVYEITQLGTNQGLYISDRNFINKIMQEINDDEIITRLTLYGENNISIQELNIAGQPWIQNLSFFKKTKYMSQDLIDALNAYDSYVVTKEGLFSGYLGQLNNLNSTLSTKKIELSGLISESKEIEKRLDIAFTTNQPSNEIKLELATKIQRINNKQIEISGVQTQISSIQTNINALGNDLSMDNHFTEKQLKDLDPFIRESDYSDSNYTKENLPELLDEGQKILAKISYPKVQVSIEVEDFLSSVEGQHFREKFSLGDLINTGDDEIGIDLELRLVGYVHNPDKKKLSLKFSNRESVDDANIYLTELLKNLTTTAGTVNFNKPRWDKGEEANFIINQYVNEAFVLAKQQILKVEGQKPIFDERGMWLYKENPDGSIDPAQLRLVNNAIVMTNDNWNTLEWVLSATLGINANAVRGKFGQFAWLDANQVTVGGGDNPANLNDELIRIQQETQDKINLVNGEISDVDGKINGLENFTNTAFKDGILDMAEKESLLVHIQQLNNEKSDVDAKYTSIYADINLIGTSKSSLLTAKNNYNTSHGSLITTINNATSDDKIIEPEKTLINNAFIDYREKLSTLSTAFENAIRAIESKKAEVIANDLIVNFNTNILVPAISGVQNQIDGKIDTWFYPAAPTLSSVPANSWTTNAIKDNHVDDLYYNTKTGYVYRFIESGSVYSWQRIMDSDITKALGDASVAKSTADGKMTVYITQPTTPYHKGDLWRVAANAADLKMCTTERLTGSYTASDWSNATNVGGALSTLSGQIGDFSSDLKLTLAEANTLKTSLESVTSESIELVNTATVLGITTEKDKYSTSLNWLTAFLSTAWLNKSYPLTITAGQRVDVTNCFKDLENKKSTLLTKITEVRAKKEAKDYTDANALKQNFEYNRTKITQQQGIEVFDNLGRQRIQIGGIDTTGNGTKNDYGLKASHTDGSFSAMVGTGFIRKWLFGESEYLTDIWIYQGIYSGWQPTSPQMIRIDLPARFRGRAGKLKFLIIPTQLNYDGLGRYQEYLRTIATIMKVENIVINNSEAYVWISAFIMTNHGLDAGGDRTNYKGLDFDLMVVGY